MTDASAFQTEMFSFLFSKGVTIEDILKKAEHKFLTEGFEKLLKEAKEELGAHVRQEF